jgi:Protein of unknown function (DUF3630)
LFVFKAWLPEQWQECGSGKIVKWRKATQGEEVQNLRKLIPTHMTLTLRTDIGCTEAIIDENCGFDRFYKVADILSDALHISFTNKIDDSDSSYWDFNYKGQRLTLHYDIYNGVSIFPRKYRNAVRKDNEAVVELANLLQTKVA